MVNVGVPDNADWNGAEQEGVAFNQVMMVEGRRVSAALAYPAPARRRPNLRVLTDTLVRRIVFEGARSIGVDVGPAGRTRTARAHREVVANYLLHRGAFRRPPQVR